MKMEKSITNGRRKIITKIAKLIVGFNFKDGFNISCHGGCH